MLPGFMSSMAMAAGGAPIFSSLSFITSATDTAPGITIPATAAIGDLAVILNGAEAGSATAPSTVVPSGFTSARNDSLAISPAVKGICSYKVLLSGDPGASVTGMTGSSSTRSIILIFRPNAPITSVSVVSANGSAISTDPAAQTITTAAQVSPLVIIGHAFGSAIGVTPSGTLTTSGTVVNGATTTHAAAYEIQNSSPANRTWDMGDVGNNVLQSLALVVT